MVIVETTVFMRQVQKLLSAEEHRQLQIALIIRPDMGAIIRGSGGLRKVRWRSRGQGKRGGLRIIYFWAVKQDRLLMLLVYPKNVQADLTPTQLKMLRQAVEAEFS